MPGSRVRCLLARGRGRCFHPGALPALLRLGRGRGASSAQIGADLNFPRSKGLPASDAGGLEEPGGLSLFDHRFSSRRRLGRGVSVCWRRWGLPRWIRGAACQSRGASGLWGYPPGCRGVEAGAGPGGRAPRGTARSGVHGFLLRARPLRCAEAGWRRRPERADGMRGLRELGASPPGSLPRLAPTREPLASGSSAGASSDARVPSQPQLPERWPRTGGWRVPSPPSGLGRLSVLQRFCAARTQRRVLSPHPVQNSGQAPQQMARGSLPKTSPFRGRWRSL